MFIRPLTLTLAAGLLLPLHGLADTTYTYVGHSYTSTSGAFTPGEYVSVSMTFDNPLAAGISAPSGTFVVPTAYVFSDGVATTSSTSDPYKLANFLVWTDESGNLVNWFVATSSDGNFYPPTDEISTGRCGSGCYAHGVGIPTNDQGIHGASYAYTDDVGMWTQTSTDLPNPTPVPEPESIALLGTGLVALFAFGRGHLDRRRNFPLHDLGEALRENWRRTGACPASVGGMRPLGQVIAYLAPSRLSHMR